MYKSMKSLVYMSIAIWAIMAFLAFSLIKLAIATILYVVYLRKIRAEQERQKMEKKDTTGQNTVDPLITDEINAYNEYMSILDWEIQNRKDIGSGRDLSDKQVARRKLEYARKARKGIAL